MNKELFEEWRGKYGDAVDSDQTVECEVCGCTVHGDEPKTVIVCWLCYEKQKEVR